MGKCLTCGVELPKERKDKMDKAGVDYYCSNICSYGEEVANFVKDAEKVRALSEWNNHLESISTPCKTFELRGDDIEVLNEIKKYIPVDREDIWSWLCYIENCLKGDF